MPRQPRLDVPGLLHHVVARGINRTAIFRDDRDREAFVGRLGELAVAGGAKVYAWCLLSNHFHLVIEPGETGLAWLMRRLLTSHAVRFNLRHRRSGHLFQNRYKNIVVEEEPYFLELVRYVALNPVRAGMVVTTEQLDQYPWSGHAAIIGRRAVPWQAVKAVLERFGKREGEAIAGYREFVAAGWEQGRREQFTGGGLIRSGGGAEDVMRRRSQEREAADERVLGGGAFVESVWQAANSSFPVQPQRDWNEVLADVARKWHLEPPQLLGGSRHPSICRARREFFLRSHVELGLSVTHLGRISGLHPSSVSRAIETARTDHAGTTRPV